MHPDLENLINIALADGELTEKKREIIIRKADALGEDKDEVEMILEGKLAQLKKQSKPTQEMAGNTIRCPQCKAAIPSFTTKCEFCGHEFRNLKATSSVQDFYEKLNAIESSRVGARNEENTKLANQKAQIISSFPVPNSKEDIFEFLSMSVSILKNLPKGGEDNLKRANGDKIIYDAWLSKSNQMMTKAKMSFPNDAQIQTLNIEYEKILESNRRSKVMKTTLIVLGVVAVIAFVIIMNVLKSKGIIH